MRPYTLHFVVTAEDCLAVGGHFYCAETLSRTMLALVSEHHLGVMTVNSSHPTALLILFNMFMDHAYWRLARHWEKEVATFGRRVADTMDDGGFILNLIKMGCSR